MKKWPDEATSFFAISDILAASTRLLQALVSSFRQLRLAQMMKHVCHQYVLPTVVVGRAFVKPRGRRWRWWAPAGAGQNH